MKTGRRLLSCFLALVLALGLLPISTLAANTMITKATLGHRDGIGSGTSSILSKMKAPNTTGNYSVSPSTSSELKERLSNGTIDLWVTSTDMNEAEQTNGGVVPYFYEYESVTDEGGNPTFVQDENGNYIKTAKWILTGIYYANENSTAADWTLIVSGDDLENKESYKFTIPDGFVGGGTGTKTDTIYIWYTWEQDGNTVTYDLNIANEESNATTGQLPASAVVYGITKSSETEVQRFSLSGISNESFKTLTVSEGAKFLVNPELASSDAEYVDYIGCVTAENGTATYYRLKGWSTGTGAPIPNGGNAKMGTTDMTLKAQWEQIPSQEYAVDSKDENYPVITLATNGNTAAVRQHKSNFNGWLTNGMENPLILNNDLEVYYQSTLGMDYPIAALLDGQAIYNEKFAHFDINVYLDDTLELKADNDGKVTFSFTTTFLRPETNEPGDALIKSVAKSEVGELTYTDLGYYPVKETSEQKSIFGTEYTEYTYTYTVPAEDLNELESMDFAIPMEWRPTENGYPLLALQQEMKLEVAVSVMTDTSKVVATSGTITGRIDFNNATNKNSENLLNEGTLRRVAAVLLENDEAWRTYCGTDAVAILRAVQCLESLSNNANMPGNTVYAKAPSYTVTVNYLDNATGEKIKDSFVTDADFVGNTYNVTQYDKIAIDSYTYSHTEGAVTGTLDKDKVINVYYIRNQGALQINKEVQGTNTSEEFTFKVTLLDGDKPLTGTYQYTGTKEGDLTLDETGSATFTLSDDDNISINKIPAGVTYQVQESTPEGYIVSFQGHDATGSGNYVTGEVAGQIVGSSGAVITCVNIYQPVYYTVTINYLERGTEKILCDPVEIRQEAGTSYDATIASERYISGYIRIDQTTGDELTGTLDGNKVINVYYEKQIVKPVTPPTTPVEPEKPALNTEDHVAYIIGYEDGTVQPQGDITRAEVTTIFFRLLTDESRAYYWEQSNDYSDVSQSNWFNNAVSTMSNAGIVTGYPDGTFRPNDPITRAEFAAIAARFSDVIYNGGNSFTDVPSTHWAARYIALAEYQGWITGYPDGTFKPDQAITRAEAMTLINRVLERAVEEEHMLPDMVKWVDNQPNAWYYEAVQEATNSHEYVRLDEQVSNQTFNYEDWQEILQVPDWASLEKAWSTANG